MTKPGNVAWVSDMVKNDNRRSTTWTPTTPAKAPVMIASSRARCMRGVANVLPSPLMPSPLGPRPGATPL